MAGFLIEAAKLAALAAMRPIFMALISSLLNPKFLLGCLIDLAEILVKHTETEFDDAKLAELKVLLKDDLEKAVKKEVDVK